MTTLMRITTLLNVTGRLCAVFLCLLLLFPSSPAIGAIGECTAAVST